MRSNFPLQPVARIVHEHDEKQFFSPRQLALPKLGTLILVARKGATSGSVRQIVHKSEPKELRLEGRC